MRATLTYEMCDDCFTMKWLAVCKEINDMEIPGFVAIPFLLISPGSGSSKTMSKRAKKERHAGNLDGTHSDWKSADQMADILKQYKANEKQQGKLVCLPIYTFTEVGGLKGHKPAAHVYLLFIDFRATLSRVWVYNSIASGSKTIPSLLRSIYKQKRRYLGLLAPTIMTGMQPDHEKTCNDRSIKFLKERVNKQTTSADEIIRRLTIYTRWRNARYKADKKRKR